MYIEDHCQTKKDPEPHSGSGPLSRSFVFSGSKLYLGVEFRTFLIFDIKIGIGVTLSYN